MYGKQQDQLEKWLDDSKIDFSNEDDLKKLFIYLQSL